ncbi:ROK family protein [Niabella aquatica]
MSEHPNKYMSEHSNKYYFGIDIGGSHISSVLIDANTNELLKETYNNQPVTSNGDRKQILKEWKLGMQQSLKLSGKKGRLSGVAVAVPGPFDYENGICLMQDVNKYNALYGLNIEIVVRQLLEIEDHIPVLFENDAACFALGESLHPSHKDKQRFIAITLGTGLGAAFIINSKIIKGGDQIPPNGELYNLPYLKGISEDYISSKWILNTYNAQSPLKAHTVYDIARRAKEYNDQEAINIFSDFGKHLASILKDWLKTFKPDCIVIGGSIAKSASLFLPSFKKYIYNSDYSTTIKISENMELSSIIGATALIKENEIKTEKEPKGFRKTSQPLMPQYNGDKGLANYAYDLYPSFNIGNNKIYTGYDTLGEWLATRQYVMIDGIVGNDWQAVQQNLSGYFEKNSITVNWYNTSDFQLPTEKINELIQPFVSEPGDVWGKHANLQLKDFFREEIEVFKPSEKGGVHIFIGCGAALANWPDLIYLDVPKNEIQYRMRAGQKVSMADTFHLSNPEIYKRLYFVDWVVNDQHRQLIYDRINIIADCQWRDNVSWAYADSIYDALKTLSANPIRVRPWFEAGAWGGQWLKQHINALNKDEVNYAWSFELIVPENGVVLESNGNVLEVAFKWLMDIAGKNILGKDYTTFGNEFPIRFDYLDTVEGGNLSIQCHPSLDYIQKEFGEKITQDETYYILDCKEEATVYLGFQEGVERQEFKNVLEESFNNNVPVAIENYVQKHNAKKHDFFLIPNQTVHSAGKNNLVLEISATPYIFTFKMYDWLRPDLDGNPRPINIEHAFKNLDFSRKGEKVIEELISRPSVIEQNDQYTLVHLPTHTEHFYDVHRIEFKSSIHLNTNNKCWVMMLVEGKSILVKSGQNSDAARFNYAETFIIPAALGEFEILNETNEPVKIIKAFIK